MSDSDDTAEATARLEQALECIAVLAQRSRLPADSTGDAREMAARLDALIARVRGTLEQHAG